MTTKVEIQNNWIDVVKFAIAVLIVFAAVVGFNYYAEQPLLYRVLALVVAISGALAIASMTTRGRDAWSFLGEAQVEARKVVWPSRQETIQTTLIVIAMVIVVAIFLSILDSFLGWLVRLITGIGG